MINRNDLYIVIFQELPVILEVEEADELPMASLKDSKKYGTVETGQLLGKEARTAPGKSRNTQNISFLTI